MTTRKCSVDGLFYPDSAQEIKQIFQHFNSSMPNKQTVANIKALIVPHAGYIYSGYTANIAYNLASLNQDIERVVVLGPSHRVFLEGASVSAFEAFETPLGSIHIDTGYMEKLQAEHSFLDFFKDAHQEHSTETQMPFIKHYFPKAKTLEIVYGKIDHEELATLTDTLLQTEKTLLVISTDLSHFYPLEKANELDDTCIKAINDLDLEGFANCEACGIQGVKALVKSAKKHRLVPEFLDYRTSFDKSGDASSVVGYTSFLFSQQINKAL